ncbi:MAG: TetR/AcrR family transcriptional regulator C-terminal domain-containing protein [Clostridiaceae bacterium]|nr:TetR/AcrR family transcriptional regulator C-terminal domain-containing protein [Clostridiaceae bacterium]
MNVKKIISTAFYELLQKYEIEEISVSQIVRAAEISKPTFYRYYRDKYDLLNQMFDVIFEPMREAERSVTWGEAMLQILTNLEQNLKFFQNGIKSEDRHSLRNYNMTCISEAITDMISRRGVDVHAPEIAFSIRSCAITHTAAVVGWVCDEHRMPKDQVVRLMKSSLPHNLYEYFTI